MSTISLSLGLNYRAYTLKGRKNNRRSKLTDSSDLLIFDISMKT